jgi:hypothetical protein
LIGIFKKRNPGSLLLLLLYAVVVKWTYFSMPQVATEPSAGGTLFQPIWKMLADGQETSIRLRWVGLLFNFIHAWQLNSIINRHKMMGAANFLPAIAYLTISAAFPQWNAFSSWSVVGVILLWTFQAQFSLYQTAQTRGAVYNRCLVLGLLPLIEPSSFPFILWGIVGIWVMRPFRWAEWWVMMIGLLTPYYFLSIWKYWNGTAGWYKVFPRGSFQLPALDDPRALFVILALLAIPTLMGMLQVQSNLRKMLIPVRKGWTQWTVWLFLALTLPFILVQDNDPGYILVLLPVAAFQACFYFYAPLRIIPLLFFWLELAAVLWIQYGGRFS